MSISTVLAPVASEPPPHISIPPPASRKAGQTTDQILPAIELYDINSPQVAKNNTLYQNSETPEVPGSDHTLPGDYDGAEPGPDQPATRRRMKWRILSACLMSFGNGINDSTPGALIPYMETHYGIGYGTVSLVFVGNAIGFLLAAPFTHSLETKLGRSRSYLLAMCSFLVGYIIIVCQPPFPVVVICFILYGFGLALNLALSNVFCANLTNGTIWLGYLHGAYGVGGTVAPLMATAMVSTGIRWSLFYTIPLGIAATNLVLSSWAFSSGDTHLIYYFPYFTGDKSVRPRESAQETGSESKTLLRNLKKAVLNRTTLLGALFIFTYQGAEVSVSGWIVSFLISYRQGDPSRVGYVGAGFWGGITVGRFFLTYPATRIGEKIAVVVMVVGAIAFQLMIWFIPNIIGEAVMVAILGVLLGAAYPCAVAVFTKLLPRHMHTSSLSFITALGSSGGAVFPFFTGMLAQSKGTVVLHPICVGLYGVMVASWLLLPRISKRSE